LAERKRSARPWADASAGKLAGVLLELGFEPFEQGESVGGGASEAGDDVALGKPANLAGV
jgi:hypothetical protein